MSSTIRKDKVNTKNAAAEREALAKKAAEQTQEAKAREQALAKEGPVGLHRMLSEIVYPWRDWRADKSDEKNKGSVVRKGCRTAGGAGP